MISKFAGYTVGAVCAFFFASLGAATLSAEPLVLATGEWRPYSSVEMEGYGEFTQRVATVIQEMGLEAEFRFYPWTRCYDSVVNGRVWAAFPYAYTESRAQEVWYSEPLHRSRTLFFYHTPEGGEEHYEFEDLEDLAGVRIGGVSGYFYLEPFEDAGLAVDYTNTEIQGIEKLILGRIDLFPVNERVGWDLILTYFPEQADNFHTLPNELSNNELSLIVSRSFPDSERLLKEFNAALQRCRDNGSIPELEQ